METTTIIPVTSIIHASMQEKEEAVGIVGVPDLPVALAFLLQQPTLFLMVVAHPTPVVTVVEVITIEFIHGWVAFVNYVFNEQDHCF